MRMKDRFKIKAFSLAEMLISMTIIMIVMVITLPPVLKRGAGNEVNSNICVIKKLASSVTLPMSEAIFNAMSDSDPCKKSINFCLYNQNKACNTLTQFSNYGKMNPDERTAARKVLRAACDLGGKEACKYFVDICKKDSSTCNRSDENDIHYYLNLLPTNPNPGLLNTQDYIGYLYQNNITNIKNEINNTCCKPDYNYACMIKGFDKCPLAKKMGGSGTDAGYGIAADSTGIYISGHENTEVAGGTSSDVFIMKLDINNGAVVWKKRLGGGYLEGNKGIAIDYTGVYVTGYQTSDPVISSAYNDIFVAKFNKSDGTNIWKKKFGGSAADTPNDIALDGSSVYITGSEQSDYITGSANSDIFVIKLNNSNGTVIWKKKYGGPDTETANGIVFDGTDIYVAGQNYSNTVTGTTNSDIFALKINISDGTIIWKKKFGGSGIDYAMGITVDSSGVYMICDIASDTVTGSDAVGVIKLYKSNGNVIWKKKFGTGIFVLADIIAGNDGIYVLSNHSGSESVAYDFFVLKLRSDNGSVIWKRNISGVGSDYARAIGLYNDDVYIAGAQKSDPVISGSTYDDVFAIRLSALKQTNNLSTYFDGYDLNTYFNAYDITYTGFDGADIGGTYFNGYDMVSGFGGTNITSTYFDGYDIDQTKLSL